MGTEIHFNREARSAGGGGQAAPRLGQCPIKHDNKFTHCCFMTVQSDLSIRLGIRSLIRQKLFAKLNNLSVGCIVEYCLCPLVCR